MGVTIQWQRGGVGVVRDRPYRRVFLPRTYQLFDGSRRTLRPGFTGLLRRAVDSRHVGREAPAAGPGPQPFDRFGAVRATGTTFWAASTSETSSRPPGGSRP